MATVLATTSAVGAGEQQELVDLMARDVGEDAAEPIAVVEPVGPALAAGEMGAVSLAVRAEAQGLHDPADPTLPDKFAGLDGDGPRSAPRR